MLYFGSLETALVSVAGSRAAVRRRLPPALPICAVMLSRLDFLCLVGLSSAGPFLERFQVGPRPERLTCLWSGPVAGFRFGRAAGWFK